MLVGKNVVIIKGEKGTLPIMKDYDRVYLEFASTDELAEYTKTTEGKDLTFTDPEGKSQIWKGLKPKNDITSAKPEDLVSDALAFFKQKYPGTIEKPTDPWLTLLEAASYGQDLWERNTIQANLRPGKPMDKNAAILKAFKMYKMVNPKTKLSDAQIMERVKLMAEDDSEGAAA